MDVLHLIIPLTRDIQLFKLALFPSTGSAVYTMASNEELLWSCYFMFNIRGA